MPAAPCDGARYASLPVGESSRPPHVHGGSSRIAPSWLSFPSPKRDKRHPRSVRVGPNQTIKWSQMRASKSFGETKPFRRVRDADGAIGREAQEKGKSRRSTPMIADGFNGA